MENYEDELKLLRERNNELIQKVQFWKMRAAEKENEKIELMKELNDFRIKHSRLRSGGAAQARKLESALQSAGKEALAHLVQASDIIAKTFDMAKTYIIDRDQLDILSPRLSGFNDTISSDKVLRVPPMLMGGKFIQPVVSLNPMLTLNRPTFNNSSSMSASRNVNVSRDRTAPVPMHVLQDVYIPLTRIDMADLQSNAMETIEQDAENSTEDVDGENSLEEANNESENLGDGDMSTRHALDIVAEEEEPEVDDSAPDRTLVDNPLEGPSWLLGAPNGESSRRASGRVTLEPDSTTELEETSSPALPVSQRTDDTEKQSSSPSSGGRSAFTPTVRRRRRPPSPPPPYSPDPLTPQHSPLSTSNRELKVLVRKMRLESAGYARVGGGASSDEATPPKRPVRFDAPSPNGATDTALIVSEEIIRSGTPGTSSSVDGTHRRSSHDNGRVRSYDKQDTRSREVGRKRTERRSKSHDSQRGSQENRPASHERKTESQDRLSENHDEQTQSQDRQSDNNDRRTESHRGRIEHERQPGSFEAREDSYEYQGSRESDRDELCHSRSRRERKPVTYREKPLNRKMRR